MGLPAALTERGLQVVGARLVEDTQGTVWAVVRETPDWTDHRCGRPIMPTADDQ